MTLVISNQQHCIRVQAVDSSLQIDHIPAMVYRISEDLKGPKLVKDRPQFNVPEKIYGEPEQYATMLFDDFQATEGTLGVILQGLKGSGKTLTAEALCNKGIAKGYPVLMVEEYMDAQSIKQWAQLSAPCIVLFDEFGKVYPEDLRKSLLTLFSDSSLSRVMFVITANTVSELNDFIVCRPGRFKYSIEFANISPMARDQLFDELKLDDQRREIFHAYASYSKVSFDVLNYAVRASLKYTDLEEMYTHLRLLNIPYVPGRMVTLGEIYIDNELHTGPHTFHNDADGLHLKIYDRVGRNVILAETFDWVPDGRPGQRFRREEGGYGSMESKMLDLSPTLSVRLQVSFGVQEEAFLTKTSVSLQPPVIKEESEQEVGKSQTV